MSLPAFHLPDLHGFGYMAVFTGVAASWRQCLGFLQRIRSHVLVRFTVEDDLGPTLTRYCWKHFRRSPFGDRRYASFNTFVRPLDRHAQVAVERAPVQPILFWRGWRPLFVSSVAAAGAAPDAGQPSGSGRITISFLRGTFQADSLIRESIKETNDLCHAAEREHEESVRTDTTLRRFSVTRILGRDRSIMRTSDSPVDSAKPPGGTLDGRFLTDRLLDWTPDDLGPRAPQNPREALVFPPEVEGLIVEARRWKDSERWFKEHQLPWRRGYLLYGEPGTGKSRLIRMLGQLLDVPIFVFDLSTLSNEELVSHWRNMLAQAPAIAAVEDIDNVFHGRENISKNQANLTFDCLLNVISGIEESDGIFTLVTTNDISKIDRALGNPKVNVKDGEDAEAISTRPGRLDRAVELRRMTADCRLRLARRILSDSPQLIDETVAAGDGDTAAQFSERCSQLALRDFWHDRDLPFVQAPAAFGRPLTRGEQRELELEKVLAALPRKESFKADHVVSQAGLLAKNPSVGKSTSFIRPPQPNRTHGAQALAGMVGGGVVQGAANQAQFKEDEGPQQSLGGSTR